MTRFAMGFYRNVVLRRKYKAFLMVIFSSQYRRDLNRLYTLTKMCTRVEMREIHCDQLEHGHQIIYPDYALALLGRTNLPPIRVVWDDSRKKFLVVDGNHRLPSLLMRAMYGTNSYIKCEVML